MIKVIKQMGISLSSLIIKAQTVSAQYGKIQGSVNGGIDQFLGIPFAKPPIDTLRWKAPQNPDFWIDTLLKMDFKPVCPKKIRTWRDFLHY